MGTIRQLPRKHASRKMDDRQEEIVGNILTARQDMATWLEAKHEYFENQEKYDKMHKNSEVINKARVAADKLKEQGIEKQLSTAATEIVKEQKKRKLLKLKETKLGVTMVLSLDDCKELGFTGDELTGEVINAVRAKLKLPPRGKRAK